MMFKGNRPTPRAILTAVALCAALMVTMLVPSQTADAASFSGSPCPSYSIQDVLNDPDSDWDNDWMGNSDELYNGTNPCEVDYLCAGGGNAGLCRYPTYYTVTPLYPLTCSTDISAFPNGDFDGDGITNDEETRNGANPCVHPCPNPTPTDLSLNPNGSWDNDGVSNAVEVSQGTNPCNGYAYNPCPHYTAAQVASMPSFDWDGDGFTNLFESNNGHNPCVWNASVTVPKVIVTQPHTTTYNYTPTHRLPHVSATTTPTVRSTYVPPKPKPVCPLNYPYYHPGNGVCYANPVSYW